jgi:hypothetical protein
MKFKRPSRAAPALTPASAAKPLSTPLLELRLSAGRHAIKAAELAIYRDGARIAGGYGVVEFDLAAEAWLGVAIIQP